MAHIVLIAHAPLASALRTVAMHVYPDCSSRLSAIDVDGGASPDAVEAVVRRRVDGLPGTEVLLVADVFGATPCNAALRVADGVRVRVVAGVNVPMLWRILCYAHEPLDCLINRATEGASQGVLQVSAPRRQNQSSPTPLHAQVIDQNQQ